MQEYSGLSALVERKETLTSVLSSSFMLFFVRCLQLLGIYTKEITIIIISLNSV